MKKAAIAIAAILVVGGAGFTGWRQWQLRYERSTNSPSNQNLTNQKTTQSTTQPPSDPSEGGKYLVITEWSVKFEVPQSLKNDIYYQIRTGEEPTIEILSKTVDLDNCAPLLLVRSQSQGFGSIEVGNHYYEVLKGAQACDTSTSERQQRANNVQSQISQALEKLEKIY